MKNYENIEKILCAEITPTNIKYSNYNFKSKEKVINPDTKKEVEVTVTKGIERYHLLNAIDNGGGGWFFISNNFAIVFHYDEKKLKEKAEELKIFIQRG